MNMLATLFNLGGPDLLIILTIVLVLFGAKKLPELARGMGQAIKEFTKAKNEFENEISRPSDKPVAEITVQKPAEQQEHHAEAPQMGAMHPAGSEPPVEHVTAEPERVTKVSS